MAKGEKHVPQPATESDEHGSAPHRDPGHKEQAGSLGLSKEPPPIAGSEVGSPEDELRGRTWRLIRPYVIAVPAIVVINGLILWVVTKGVLANFDLQKGNSDLELRRDGLITTVRQLEADKLRLEGENLTSKFDLDQETTSLASTKTENEALSQQNEAAQHQLDDLRARIANAQHSVFGDTGSLESLQSQLSIILDSVDKQPSVVGPDVITLSKDMRAEYLVEPLDLIRAFYADQPGSHLALASLVNVYDHRFAAAFSAPPSHGAWLALHSKDVPTEAGLGSTTSLVGVGAQTGTAAERVIHLILSDKSRAQVLSVSAYSTVVTVHALSPDEWGREALYLIRVPADESLPAEVVPKPFAGPMPSTWDIRSMYSRPKDYTDIRGGTVQPISIVDADFLHSGEHPIWARLPSACDLEVADQVQAAAKTYTPSAACASTLKSLDPVVASAIAKLTDMCLHQSISAVAVEPALPARLLAEFVAAVLRPGSNVAVLADTGSGPSNSDLATTVRVTERQHSKVIKTVLDLRLARPTPSADWSVQAIEKQDIPVLKEDASVPLPGH